MKKIRLFLMLLVLSAMFPVIAQKTPVWKASGMETWKIQYVATEDGKGSFTLDSIGEVNTFNERNYYDKHGNLILNLIYNADGNTLRERHVYTYNKQNKMLSEFHSATRYSTVYEYDNSGLKLLKSTKTNTNYNTVAEIREYIYDSNNLLVEENIKTNDGKVTGRYKYMYEGNVLKTREYYTEIKADGTGVLTTRTDYVFDNQGRELKEASYVYISYEGETKEREFDRKCYEYDESGKLIVDSLYYEHLMSLVLVPTAKHVYTYNGDNVLVKNMEYGGDSDKTPDMPNCFPRLFQYYIYVNRLYGEDYAPANVSVTAGSEIATVKVKLDAPAIKKDVEGYKVMVDGEFIDETFTGTEFTVKKQKKGEHIYHILPIYNGEMGSASDPVTCKLDIDCPPVTNLQVSGYEWIYESFTNQWKLAFTWDAPAANGLTFKNYNYMVGTSKGTSIFNNATATYSKKDKVTITVSAVYEEGESEPCTIEFDLSDPTKQVIKHWNNSGYVMKDAKGAIVGSSDYYYKVDGNTENLLFEVQYDAQNIPSRKIELISTFSSKSENQYAWDKETASWSRDTYISYQNNNYYQPLVKIIKTANADGKLVETAREVYDYAVQAVLMNDPKQTDYWTLVDGTLTLTSVKKHIYDATGRTDMIYKADSVTITGKEEYYYLGSSKIDSIKVYTYANDKYTLVSKTVFSYLSGTNLVASEKKEKYAYGKWAVEYEKIYTASPAYHKTHVVSNIQANEGDNVMEVSWTAPADSEGLSGYKVYANDVILNRTLVPAANTTYTAKGLPTGNFAFSIVAVYNENQDANYTSSTIMVEHTDMTALYANLGKMISAGVSTKGYSYGVAGEVLVTGALDAELFGEGYFVEDSKGAVKIVSGTEDHTPAFTFKDGDKIKNLKGLLQVKEDGTHYFIYQSADLVSKNNQVSPTIMTLKDFVANASASESKYIKFEKVAFSDNVDATTNLLPSVSHMVQDGATANLMLGANQIEKPDSANVAGFVMKNENDWVLVLNGKKDFKSVYIPKEFANLKAMLDAGADKNYRTYIVKGEVLVTGAITSFIGSNYYVEDATAALCLQADEMSDFSTNVGDKVKELTGILSENNGVHSFSPSSVVQVSAGNTVTPKVMTIATLNENPANYESRYVRFEEVTFNGISGVTVFPAETEMVQGNNKVNLIIGQEQIPIVELANVSGFVSLTGDPVQIILNGKNGLEDATGISTIGVAGIYYENGEIAAEGASLIEVFDMTGRKLVYNESERAELGNVNSGVIAVKVTYADGNAKVVKFAVK